MNFYNNAHPYYCGIDLHARILYVCIIDLQGEIVLHQKITADKEALLTLLASYIGNIVVGVECMHVGIGSLIGATRKALISS